MSQEAVFWLFLGVVATFFGVASLSFGPVARLAPLLVSVGVLALVALQLALRLSPRLARRLWWAEVGDVFRTARPGGGDDGSLHKRLETPTDDAGQKARPTPSLRDEVRMVAWLAGLVAAIWLVGMYAGVAAFVALFLRRAQGESWRGALAVALAVTLAAWAVFERMFGVRLYPGLFGLGGGFGWTGGR